MVPVGVVELLAGNRVFWREGAGAVEGWAAVREVWVAVREPMEEGTGMFLPVNSGPADRENCMMTPPPPVVGGA